MNEYSDNSSEEEINDNNNDDSEIKLYEHGAHFRYVDLCVELERVVKEIKGKENKGKKEKKKEIKSRNMNINNVVRDSNINYDNNNNDINRYNKTSINKNGIGNGERILNNIQRNKNEINIRMNKFQNKNNPKKVAKSTSNPKKKINKMPLSMIKANKEKVNNKKANSQNILKNKKNTSIKRKAYSSSNSKSKPNKFTLQYGKIKEHNNDNKTISTVNCIKSLVKNQFNYMTLNTNKKTSSKSKQKTIDIKKSRNTNNTTNLKVSHLKTYNNVLTKPKRNHIETKSNNINFKEIFNKLSNLKNSITLSSTIKSNHKVIKPQPKQERDITQNKHLKYSSPSFKINKLKTPNVTVSIDVTSKNENSSRNQSNSIKNHILTSSINRMKRQIEKLYTKLNYSNTIQLKKKKQIISSKTRSHNNTNIYNKHIDDNSKLNYTDCHSYLQKNKTSCNYKGNTKLSNIFHKDLRKKLANLSKITFNEICK